MEEIWLPINESKDYLISNIGDVKSLLYRSPRNLKPDDSTGYYRVKINKRWVPVHRLIAEAFIPNPMNKPYVNHIDENKLNNSLSNLEWVTHGENLSHSRTKKTTTKIRGVHWNKRMKMYQCNISFDKNRYYLGSYRDKSKATEVVNNFIKTNKL